MDAGLADPSHLASSVGHLRSLTYMSSDGAASSGVKFSEEAEGSAPEGRDAWVEIDLDDEPGSLLDFLNVWREKVAAGLFRGILGLSRPVEVKLLDLLVSQLDREFVSHNMMVKSLEGRMSGVL